MKDIFFEEHQHWDRFVEKHGNRVRSHVIKGVEKFQTCGTYENGFKFFVCEGCHDVRRVALRCKGRFCTACSDGETEEWGRFMTEDMLQVGRRYVIFTIDEGLRMIFLQHREMLKSFVDEAVKLVQEWFKKKCKVVPGIIAGLHTFGSCINFNPHIHMLVTILTVNTDHTIIRT